MGFLDKIRANQATPATAYDPVCGMTIDPADAAGTSQHAGKTIHFCSAGCKRKFDAEPAKYASKIKP
jgi:P-type Cu+ transporter